MGVFEEYAIIDRRFYIFYQLLEVFRESRSINVGAYSRIDAKSPAVLEAADFAIFMISSGIDSMYSLKRVNVESAFSQVRVQHFLSFSIQI